MEITPTPLITIFTPTYNRAYIIGKLYESLCRQSFRDFEWLVVDDGSTDNTAELLAKFSVEGKIDIRYIRQENGGKHRAINRGVKEARGELFFIVDSDDHLTDNALERLAFHYRKVRDDPTFAGVSGVRKYPDGSKIGGEEKWKILECSYLQFMYKFKGKGDMAEAFKTSILRKFPFPEFEGEQFCPESVVWNRIAQRYKLMYFYEKIYVCEYLADGLTRGGRNLLRQSPRAAMLWHSGLLRYADVPLKAKAKSTINFWRFAFASSMSFWEKLKIGGGYSLPGFIPGILMFIIDGLRLRK